jgi:ribonuclease-3
MSLIRFFRFSRKKEKGEPALVSFITKNFGYRPRHLHFFTEAFTHSSFSNTQGDMVSNERLEYLGDCVIDLIVAEYLFQQFPDRDEGYLTKVKAKIVNRNMLAYIGGELQLRKHIRYKTGRSIRIETLEGNALEALIGAIYLDAGFEAAKKVFVSYILSKYVDFNEVLEQEIDFKSTLLIWGQKNKLAVQFKVTDEATKENAFIYTSAVEINNKDWGMGRGKSKKEAEQHASRETLALLGLI